MPASVSPLVDRLRAIVGSGSLLSAPSELLVYECDGLTIEKNKPDVVVFPTTTEQVVQAVRVSNPLNPPFLPRGTATSLAVRSLPGGRAAKISLSPINRILEADSRHRSAAP